MRVEGPGTRQPVRQPMAERMFLRHHRAFIEHSVVDNSQGKDSFFGSVASIELTRVANRRHKMKNFVFVFVDWQLVRWHPAINHDRFYKSIR